MTTYRYLGWGKTNENGIAKLDHNSEGQEIEHSYTGTGAGEIDVLASLDNPVAEGSIVSEIYEVYDCTFKDIGTSTDYNSTWTNNGNNITVSRSDEYTTLTPTFTGNQNRYILPSSAIPTAPFVIEFDKHFTGTSNEVLVLGDRAIYMHYFNITNANHVKLQINDDRTIYIWVDSERQFDSSYTDMSSIRWQLNNTGTEIKYSNFKVYPI